MTLLLLIAAAVAAWAWRSGSLRDLRFGDVAAVVAALAGVRLLGHGSAPLGLIAIVGAGAWGWLRMRRVPPAEKRVEALPLAEARSLLDLPPNPDRAAIEAAHRRIIGRVHPDAGGSTELARRVNGARDTLIDDFNRRTPRAS